MNDPSRMWPNPPALVSLWTDTPAGRIHSRTNRLPQSGAPAVIFLHGAVLSGIYLLPTAELLAHSARIQVPDLPGYGASDKPWPPLDLPALAGALAQWLEAVSLPRAHMVGAGFGCQVVIELALRRPELVDRLVLVGPTGDPAGRGLARRWWRSVATLPQEAAGIARIMRHDYRQAGLRRALFTHRLALDGSMEGKLPRISAPALVVRGSRDRLVPRAWAARVAGLLGRGELAELPGAGHALAYSAPGALAEQLFRFLDLS